jgi:manganese/iron transport system permease protein
MIDYIADPLSDAEFVRGLVDVTAVAVVAGVVGTFIVLRGLGFLGDALAHAIFPGVVIAFLAGSNLLAGALIAGVVTTALMGGLTANQRVRDNTSIGVVFTAAFALGIVILTGRDIAVEELEEILFGDPVGSSSLDMALTLSLGVGVLLTMLVVRRLLVVASFDPAGARAMGLPVLLLDVLLLALTALTVVVAFKAVGNILVIALLITPAATARLLTDRLTPMMLLSCAIGAVAAVAGLFVGYNAGTSAGGAIVLMATTGFFATWLFAPRTGLVTTLISRRGGIAGLGEPEAEAEIIMASPEIQSPHTA